MDHIPVLGVDREGMAAALVGQDLDGSFQHRILAVHHEEGQHGAELLHGVGPVEADFLFPGHQDLGPGGDREAGFLSQYLGGTAHDIGAQTAVGAEEELSQHPCFPGIHKVITQLSSLGHDLLLQPALHDDALLRGTDGAVVEVFGAQDQGEGLPDIGAVMDIGRTIACPHTDGGLSGGIGRPDHAGAAGGQDQFYFRSRHQLLASCQSRHRETPDAAFRSPRPPGGIHDDLGCPQGAADGLWMRREDDGVP